MTLPGAFFDSNNDKQIDFSEFIVAYVISSEFFRKEIRRRKDIQAVLFNVMDKNGNGTVDLQELTMFIHIATALGLAKLGKNTPTTQQFAKEWMKSFDTNGDGSIDFDEFCALEQRAISYHALMKNRKELLQDNVHNQYRKIRERTIRSGNAYQGMHNPGRMNAAGRIV